MQPVPRIFVSATSRDLRTARGLVAEGLRRMECLPIVQDDFPPDYKSVRDMLRAKISTCNAVVHLAGFYYGAEPQPVLPGPDRRSFTQMEYEIAMELKLPCYVFLCGKDFPFDPHDPEPEDKQQLQLAHRERLLQRDELFYEFASLEDLANRTRELQLSVENLRKELVRERSRRRLAMGAAVAALVIAVAGGVYLRGRQEKTDAVNVQQSSEIAELKAQLEGPWAIVNKVNAAMEALARQTNASPDELKKAAVAQVAEEMKKSPEEIGKAIEATTTLAQKLIAAARAEGDRDASKRTEARKLEAETLEKLAKSHQAAGRYAESLAAYKKRLELLDKEGDPETWLDALVAVADTEVSLAQYEEARRHFEEAVAFGEKQPKLGLGHLSTVFATNRFCNFLLYSAVKPADAEKLMRRVLDARLKAFGEDHADTLAAMGRLGEILADRENFEEAEPLAERALKASERTLGPEHRTTLALVDDVAAVARARGNFKRAIELYERSYNHVKKTRGPENATTLGSANLLAGLYQQADQIDKAETLYRFVLASREKALGPDHPRTLFSTARLATLLAAKEQYEDAGKLLRRAIAGSAKALGEDHPDTLSYVNDLGGMLSDQKDFAGAEKYLRRVAEGRDRSLGPDHSYTIDAYAALGRNLYIQNKSPEAEPYLRRVLKARETEAPRSRGTALALHSLAGVLGETGKREEAVALSSRAVAMAADVLPPEDGLRKRMEQRLAELKNPTTATESTAATTAAAAASEDSEEREKSRAEKLKEKMAALAKKSAPSGVAKPPPSLEAYVEFRKNLNEKSEQATWKTLRKDLPGTGGDRRVYVKGWYEDGKTLRRAMKVDARGDSDGTFTFYYWSQGWLTSVFRVREGAAVPIKDVKKATDTYNFFNGKMVSWKRTQDTAEKVEDPEGDGFPDVAKRVNEDGKDVEKVLVGLLGSAQ